MEDLDRAALTDYFNRRRDAESEAMRAYWAGRIDGHCLQNALDIRDLTYLAHSEGFRLDWPSALDIGPESVETVAEKLKETQRALVVVAETVRTTRGPVSTKKEA